MSYFSQVDATHPVAAARIRNLLENSQERSQHNNQNSGNDMAQVRRIFPNALRNVPTLVQLKRFEKSYHATIVDVIQQAAPETSLSHRAYFRLTAKETRLMRGRIAPHDIGHYNSVSWCRTNPLRTKPLPIRPAESCSLLRRAARARACVFFCLLQKTHWAA